MPEVLKIAITGPESTGKSRLAEQLAAHFRTLWVPEYARTFIDHLNRPYVEDDILTIAKGQIISEQELESQASGFLFCDTELLVTKIWSEFKYGRCNPWILDRITGSRYHLYLLCDIDIPWADDPQREHPHKRKELFDLYFRELTGRGLPFRVISGLGKLRFENAIRAIREFPCPR